MKDEEKTKEQLLSELAESRQRIAEMEVERKQAEKALQEAYNELEQRISNRNWQCINHISTRR